MTKNKKDHLHIQIGNAVVNCSRPPTKKTVEALTNMIERANDMFDKLTEKTMTTTKDSISGFGYTPLPGTVFPSPLPTIGVWPDDYDGAHKYILINSLGFSEGEAKYDIAGPATVIQFVHKKLDGEVIPGLQSEQLAIILKDRVEKLGAKFPHPQMEKMIAGLDMFLEACRERIEDRMKRDVMGDLKK